MKLAKSSEFYIDVLMRMESEFLFIELGFGDMVLKVAISIKRVRGRDGIIDRERVRWFSEVDSIENGIGIRFRDFVAWFDISNSV